jgi:perosamine synthetase
LVEKGNRRYPRKEKSQSLIVPHSKPLIEREEIKAVTEVLSSGQIAQGKKVEEFEAKVADFIGSEFAIAVSSGTTALHLALLGLGIRKGDDVILPSYVCASPYLAILYSGATPRIADISPLDYNICVETAKKEITSKTRAIIVPHMFGMPAEIQELCNLGVPVIEDCAQSFGAEYGGKRVGRFGKVSIFSFYATKMITTGEGGMILTDNRDIYHKILALRDYDKRSLNFLRFNYKMTDLQAALGITQLKRLDAFIRRRREIASFYTEQFSRFNIKLPESFSRRKSVFYRYVIELKQKSKVQGELKQKGVICENPVWKPLHKSLAAAARFPSSDYAYNHALSIPIYPALSQNRIEYVVRTLCYLFKKYS